MTKIISNDMLPVDAEAPKIEFPCDYPIKILGDACENFSEIMVEVVKRHAPDLDITKISLRESSKGRFHSLTVTIIATGKPQLESIFTDLKATGIVKMVL